uniref:Calretinin n=1 Tax=Cyprinus carpio carpio TaxID=630221 RepID=A0A8C1ACW2_CYPCA
MANKGQQPPYLHLAELTASQFLDIWKHFDADGNGYIEGKELENFFSQLEIARRGAGVDPSNAAFKEKMKEFMHKFDKNKDGRIEMSELAQILPTEENFLLCFRQFVGSSTEFMTAWRKYDTDRSGFIEANELKGFLSDLLKKANRHYDDQKLQEYTQTILKMFDLNGDGKLGLSEMARLLPVQENFLLKFQVRVHLYIKLLRFMSFLRSNIFALKDVFIAQQGVRLTAEQFNAIFAYYDKDGNGYIDEQELDALLKDLYEKNNKDVDSKSLTGYKQSIMALSDGGKLYRTELEIVLCREPML